MNRFLGVFLLFQAIASVYAQDDCTGGRYVTYELFPDVILTSDVVYGQNRGVNGNQQILELDVYEPAGDLNTERATVVVGFGGSFIAGAKEDVAFLCEELAKLGYVAIAPNYRVGIFTPGAVAATEAVLRGAHDMKAAIRYLYRSVQIDGNPWGIDTTRILIGGVSAGAISAIQAVYMDERSEFPVLLNADIVRLGNIGGNSGNLGFSEDVLAVWSMSGAIADTLLIQAGDPPIISIHDEGDIIVPYFTEEVSVFGIPTGLTASGSHDIHSYVESLGIDNCLLTFPGTGHLSYLASDLEGSLGFVIDFLGDITCDQTPDCGQLIVSVPERQEERLHVHPNPTTGSVTLELNGEAVVELRNSLGQLLQVFTYQGARANLDMGAFPKGIYSLYVRTGKTEQRQLLIKQ